MRKEDLKSVADYAALCKVTKTIIFKRINKGEISKRIIDGSWYIDATKYPPTGAKPSGRISSAQKLALAK